MKLPFSLKLDKKKPALFLVLVLRDEKVDAVIFEEQAGIAQVVGQHEERFQNSIDSISLEEFLDILDRSISKAQSSLPDGSEPQKTIFGVKEDWIENDKINKEHLLKLKKACDELGLTPIGFLIISQAISYLLQKEEGAPLSAILVDAGKTSITVSLIKGGKIVETKSKNIEDKIPPTVDALLKEFTPQENLPSRIIVFDGKQNLNFEFISHQWSKNLPFLHLPQITNLNSDFPARAVLFGVATQMGFEVLGTTEKENKDSKENPPAGQRPMAGTHEFENLTMEHFGFVKDTDVAQAKGPDELSLQHTPSSFINGQTGSPPKTELEISVGSEPLIKAGLKNTSFFDFTKTTFRTINEFLSKMSQSFPSFSLPINSKKALLIPVLFAILLIGSVAFYLFGINATVLLDIKPKIINQDNNVTFSASSPADETKDTVNGKAISVSLEGEVSTPTSGKKEVGTKAKGTVTIFNNTDSSKTLSKDTIITSSNDLNFVIEESVTIASASGDVFSGTTPGKTKANVVAGKIGTEFNLPSNTKFSIGDNPSIAAKNDESFSGGTKKEISVVSKNDVDKLLEELPKKLLQKAEEELPKQIAPDETLLPIMLAASITKKDFDKDIDDEADRLTLKGTVIYKALSYNKKDLVSQSASTLKRDISSGQILEENNIKISVKNIKQQNEKEVNALLSLEAILLPKIDEKKIIKTIVGASYKEAEKVLMKLPQTTNVKISSSFEIPFFPKNLPRIAKNIKIVVNAE